MDLPSIDTHRRRVHAPAAKTWDALLAWASRGWSNEANARFARLLGCDPAAASGEPGRPGSTLPGFRITGSMPPHELGLAGRHRFSSYTLDFRIEDDGPGSSVLSATTHAAFPGLRGQLYKTAVIRSRLHVLATRRILRAVATHAERARLS